MIGITPRFVDQMDKTVVKTVSNRFPAQYKIWFVIKII